jgi:hypothetical protein
MVAVDGARHAPAARPRRLLRRTLLVAALAAAGWLLSVVFAATAAATDSGTDEPVAPPPGTDQPAAEDPAAPGRPTGEPADRPDELEPGVPAEGAPVEAGAADPGRLLASLTSTLSHTLTETQAVTQTVTHTAHEVDHAVATYSVDVAGTAEQVVGMAVTTERTTATPAPRAAPVRAAPKPARPHVPPAIPASDATAALAPAHPPRPAAAASDQLTPSPADRNGEHADRHGPESPDKAPAPAAPGGTSVSSSHDNAGGARGTHGVLTDSAPLPRPAAGFTTRSRATDATGRVTGLPATSPD